MDEQGPGRILVLEPEEASIQDVLFERIAGALIGGAIADALGWPTEFAKKPEDLAFVGLSYPVDDFVAWHKRTGGRFLARTDNIQPGDYSDDTQLVLALARSVHVNGAVDNRYFAKEELKYWVDYARGAGATVTAAAKSAGRARTEWRWNYFRYRRGNHELDYRGAGANGAAMRMAPIALGNVRDPRRAYEEAWKNALVTHGHPRAIIGAVVFVEALRRLVQGHTASAADFVRDLQLFVGQMQVPADDPDIRFWLSRWNEGTLSFEPLWREFRDEMVGMIGKALEMRNSPLSETYRLLGAFAPATKGSGTACVAAALALFLKHGGRFDRLAVEGANLLGSDTDTIGAMAGAMAGAWHGYVAIPERWAAIMADYSYLNRVAEFLTLVTLRQGSSAIGIRPKPGDRPPQPQMNLLAALERQDVQERRPYWHPLFGVGTVTKVESQQVGLRQPRGRVVMATVRFEFGQTCKFNSFKSLKRPDQPLRRTRKRRADQMDLPL